MVPSDPHDDSIRRRMALLDTLLNHAPIRMAFVDTDMRFIEVNHHVADNHGLPAAEHVGRTLREVVGEDLAPELEAPFRAVLESGEALSDHDVAGAFPSGTKTFRTSYYPVHATSGELVGAVVLGIEVTDVEELRADARHTSAEYRRALRDYTQLTRHRLANPLTALTGGVSTLIDLEHVLDSETRMQVLASMRETTARLEQAVLHPELVSDEESELQPVPQVGSETAAHMIGAAAVQAEEHARDMNESVIEQVGAVGDQDLVVFCECWSIECGGRLRMPVGEYFATHAREDQFVVCPGHVLPTVEQVVDRQEGWWVVRKFEAAMQAARDAGGASR